MKKLRFIPVLLAVLTVLAAGQMLLSRAQASASINAAPPPARSQPFRVGAGSFTVTLPIIFGSGTALPEADVSVDFALSAGTAPETYGTNGWWTDEDAETWNQRYAELNPRVVRVPVGQVYVEPFNDNDDPLVSDLSRFHFDTPIPYTDTRNITYDQWFAALQDADFTIMLHIPYLSPWLSNATDPDPLAAPYPPNDIAEYQEFVRVLLSHLVNEIGFSPERIILEPANEPDLPCGADPAVACFWEDWTTSDLAAVLSGAAQAAAEVDDRIRIAGPALCCQMGYLDQLMNQYQADTYLDILTYHHYNNDGDPNFDAMLSPAAQWEHYNKPVYLDEYGNKAYWSNGTDGGLWHSAALTAFWEAALPPIQFSMAEMPIMHEGYNELGLFYNWRQNWATKPAYWVYVNFYNNLPGRDPVSATTPTGMPGMAAKASDQSLAIWLTNYIYERDDGGEIVLRVENWPFSGAQVQVLDNLSGSAPVATFDASADDLGRLSFTYPIPMRQSLLFLVSAPEPSGSR